MTRTLNFAFGLVVGSAGRTYGWRGAPGYAADVVPRSDGTAGSGSPRSTRMSSCPSVISRSRALALATPRASATKASSWPIAATASSMSLAALAAASLAFSEVTSAAGIVPAVPQRVSSASTSANDVVTRKVNLTRLALPALSLTPTSHVCLPSESCEASSGSG